MIFTKQGFLEAYDSLAKGQKKAANQYIMALEKSEEAWRVACELIDDANPIYRLYGAQLFSKRVSSERQSNINSEEAVRFLFSAISKNSNEKLIVAQLCLGVAKILASSRACLDQFLQAPFLQQQARLSLSIIKELPQSISSSNLLRKEQFQQLYLHVEPLIVQSLGEPSMVDQAVACLQNFEEFFKTRILYRQQVVKLLVGLPVSKTVALLTGCFNELTSEKVQSDTMVALAEYVLKAVQVGTSDQEVVSMFLEFSRFYITHDPAVPPVVLQHTATKVLQCIAGSRDRIVDTFQFWMDLQKYAATRADYSQLIFQAMLKLNQVVIAQSKLSELVPRTVGTDHCSEVIDLDSDEPQDFGPLSLGVGVAGVSDGCISFREYAADFLLLCFKTIRDRRDIEQKYFQELREVIGQDPLSMEHCIFILKSIVDELRTEQYSLTYPIFSQLFSSYEMLPDQLLVPFLQLLFDSDKILFSNDQLFVASLLFFNKIFNQQRLMRLSTQTFSNIVADLKVAGSAVKSTIEQFMGLIFKQLQHYTDDTVIENLIGAIVTLIVKFDDPSSTYTEFLRNYSIKVASLDESKRLLHYKALFPCHQRIVEDAKLHLIMAEFVNGFYVNLLADYSRQSDKKSKASYVTLLTVIAKSCGMHIPTTISNIAAQLLQEVGTANFPQIGVLYFISAMMSYDLAVMQAYYLPFLTTVWQPTHFLLISLPMTSERAKILIEIGAKLVPLSSDHTVSLQYALKALREVAFNYELIRQILKYFVILVARTKIDLREILYEVLKRYEVLSDPFQRTVMDLLIESYKKGGDQLFEVVLREVRPSLLHPSPVFPKLMAALREGDSKSIKNLLM